MGKKKEVSNWDYRGKQVIEIQRSSSGDWHWALCEAPPSRKVIFQSSRGVRTCVICLTEVQDLAQKGLLPQSLTIVIIQDLWTDLSSEHSSPDR